jgi:hypothetical protein
MENVKLFNNNNAFGDITNIIWAYAKVVDINDPYDAGRIKVRMPIEDRDTSIGLEDLSLDDGGLPWCEPLLPKYLNIVPEVGQLVKVTTFNIKNKKIRRQYIGPGISQIAASDLLNPEYDTQKTKIEFSSYTGKWSAKGDAIDGDWKIYPDKSDVAFLGKRNTDIILRNKNFFDEIQLRVGKIDSVTLNSASNSSFRDSPLILNKKNPGYITINFTEASGLQQKGISNNYKNLNLQKDRSHVNIVADHINFISHLTGDQPKILQGQNIVQQIDVENSKLHPVIYGDVLWDFMQLLRSYIEGHVHKGAGKTIPDENSVKQNLIKWFNDNMGTPSKKTTSNGKDTYIEIDNCTFLSKGVKTN